MKSLHSHAALILFALGGVAEAQPGLTATGAQAAPAREIGGFDIASTILGRTRHIRVALPPSYQRTGADRTYPIAVVFDGESTMGPTVQSADQLARNGQAPEMIVVGIDNVGGDRERVYDLTPPGLSVSGSNLNQGGDRFLDFVEKELLPAIDARFRGGQPRVLLGHSSGAILATYAAASRPAFRAVVAVDGPVQFQQNWLVNKVIDRARSNPSSLSLAVYAAKFPWPDAAWKRLVEVAPANWTLQRDSLRLEGHETAYPLGAYLGLREVFRDYSRIAAQQHVAAELLPYYERISKSFGASVVPPRRVLNDLVDDLIAEGRGADARRAYQQLRDGYGPVADSVAMLAEIREAERITPPTETVQGLLATPFPTPDQARRFVGEWRGDLWMTEDQPRGNNLTLRIRVDSGRVVAETKNANAPGELGGWIKVDYLRITANGLTWGRLNGMRPRGVMMWEGTLRSDTLSGPGRWGGVSITNPPEMKPGFSLVRVR